LLIGWLFFFIAILPTMQIIGFSDVIASDKFAYLPSVGLLLSLTWFLTRSWNGRRKLWQVGIRRVALVVIVMVLALLEGVATRRYLVHWQETESHWRYMISMAPHSHSLHSGLAYAFLQKGKVDEAIKECHEALRLKPTDSIAYHGLGIALTQKNELDQAIACYKEALKIGPDDARTHSDLAVALLQKGRVDGAIEECRHALRLKPDSFITHHRLGMALTQKNRVDQAIGHYNRALELNPDYAKAHCDLGFALLQKGQVKPAIKHFRESVRLEPNFHSGLNNLAWVLATHENPEVRNPVEAIQLAEQACEISHYKQPGNLDTLAAAYAAAGRFDEAVEIAEKAVELSSEDKTQADEIRSRLSLYRERKPYYELAQPIR